MSHSYASQVEEYQVTSYDRDLNFQGSFEIDTRWWGSSTISIKLNLSNSQVTCEFEKEILVFYHELPTKHEDEETMWCKNSMTSKVKKFRTKMLSCDSHVGKIKLQAIMIYKDIVIKSKCKRCTRGHDITYNYYREYDLQFTYQTLNKNSFEWTPVSSKRTSN